MKDLVALFALLILVGLIAVLIGEELTYRRSSKRSRFEIAATLVIEAAILKSLIEERPNIPSTKKRLLKRKAEQRLWRRIELAVREDEHLKKELTWILQS